MKIIAIDSTGLVSSVAIVSPDKVIGEFTINNKITHAETLAPMLNMLMQTLEISTDEIDYVACASGPGSFTGLRIGGAFAKGIAHGLNKKIIPVPTLDSLAANIVDFDSIIVPIMDAKRNQVYTSYYKYENQILKNLSEYKTISIDEVFDEVSNYNKNIIFLGDATDVYKDKIINYSSRFFIAPNNNKMQRAASVGFLAAKNIESAIDYQDFKPFYLRMSQAEREYREKNGEI